MKLNGMNNKSKTMKCYAFMPFWHWSEIADEKPEDSDYILGDIIVTTNHSIALTLYAEVPCPASQLIEADSVEDLEDKMIEMKENFKNPEWVAKLEECL